MNKKALIISLSTVTLLLLAAPVFASNEGLKTALGFDGDKFGATVSEIAKSEPGAVADLVSNSEKRNSEEAQVKPEKGDMSGKEYGEAVSHYARNKNKDKTEKQNFEQDEEQGQDQAEESEEITE